MSNPVVLAVQADSKAHLAGVLPGDEIRSINGVAPTDVIQYQMLVEEPDVSLVIDRSGLELEIEVSKLAGEPLGIEVASAIFDQVRTCDNHCEFCFIYQLPPGLRQTLYMKDDDYRLSFLYGNFTTLTRFTEADLERVITEHLSPLFVSIHATHPRLRTELLRNRRGGTSLRWLSALLEAGIEVHGQLVICPGINDGDFLAETLLGILSDYPDLADVAAVPLGVSRYSHEGRMRPHTQAEAARVVEIIAEMQQLFLETLGRPMVYASDEYYLVAGADLPAYESYGDFSQHENGIGITRSFERAFQGEAEQVRGVKQGFFAWVEGAPKEGYRAVRSTVGSNIGLPRRRGQRKVALITSTYGAQVLPSIVSPAFPQVGYVEVENRFFGGNVGVAGLMVGEDIAAALEAAPEYDLFLLPDVCLSEDRFLDGATLESLPFPIEVVPTDGASLRAALAGHLGEGPSLRPPAASAN